MSREPADEERRLRPSPPSEVDGEPWAEEQLAAARGLGVGRALLRFGVPALAALALVLVLVSDTNETDNDLHIIAPSSALPGELLPLRALLYVELRGIAGPHLAQQEVRAELRSPSRSLARGMLRAARSGTGDLEGALALPSDYEGPAQVVAKVHIGSTELSATAQISIARTPRGVIAEGRSLRALQHFSEGVVQTEPGAIAPAPLRTRVVGGACVPEEPCTVLLHVGEPAAQVWVEANSALSPSAAAARPSPVTNGVVALDFVTHGPEAELWLRASRATVLVARRSVRLPVAMASATLQVGRRVWAAPATPTVSVSGDAGGCIVEALRIDERGRGQWLRTGSLSECSAPQSTPFAALTPGIYRLQARRDPFSADTSGTRTIYVRSPYEDDAAVLTALAHLLLASDPGDQLASEVRSDPGPYLGPSFASTLAYLTAGLETGVYPRPAAVTGYAQSLLRMRASQSEARALALIALCLAGLALGLSVGRRGLSASLRASQILVSAGQDAAHNRRARLRSVLAVVASVVALLLVFVVIALYVMARGVLRLP